jgi:hypothetical protein
MSRLTMVLAAAVATAMLVVAVSALEAVGADTPAKVKAPDDLTGKLADCLRDRGVAVPALTGDALDHWLQTHRIPDADGRECKTAVAPPEAEVRKAPSMGVKQLSDCLRAQGFDVPTDPVALKQWIGRHSLSASNAIEKCGVVMKPEPAPCGAASKPGPDSPEAPRPDPGTGEPAT